MKSLVISAPMAASNNQYASCPQLAKGAKGKAAAAESDELQAVRRFTAKYDSYQGLIQAASRRPDSPDGSSSDEPSLVTEQERMQTESFFRGLKTQVYVSSTLANLYFGTAKHAPSPGGESSEPEWELMYTGIPVVILDLGETRSRRKRRIQILLAERGSCFTLWRDTIDNLTAYKQVAPAFHTMYLSSDHRRVVGLSFDSAEAADELLAQVDALTARPENISLSVPKGVRRPTPAPSPPKRLPPKAQISQPACFQHVTSVLADDRSRYFSLQTLLPELANLAAQDVHEDPDP